MVEHTYLVPARTCIAESSGRVDHISLTRVNAERGNFPLPALLCVDDNNNLDKRAHYLSIRVPTDFRVAESLGWNNLPPS
jgi:hypothetical protein